MNRKFRLYNGQGLQVIIEEHEDDEICGAGTLCLEDAVDILNKQQKEIVKLEKQLAEKDGSIKMIMKEFGLQMQEFGKCKDACGYYMSEVNTLQQEKTTFAIEQLEKVKKWFIKNAIHDEFGDVVLEDYTCSAVVELLDNQIKELKEQL